MRRSESSVRSTRLCRIPPRSRSSTCRATRRSNAPRGCWWRTRRANRNIPAPLTSKCLMDTLLQDLRYAARALGRNPGFAALTILCLALGIGVNSTIFSVVDTVAIRPLPFAEAEDLVVLHATRAADGVNRGGASYPDLQDWKSRSRSFTTIAATTGRTLAIT